MPRSFTYFLKRKHFVEATDNEICVKSLESFCAFSVSIQIIFKRIRGFSMLILKNSFTFNTYLPSMNPKITFKNSMHF